MLTLVALLATTPLRAGGGALTVTPAVVQLRGTFGQSTTQHMSITNGTSRAAIFELVAQDVVVNNSVRAFTDAGDIAGSIAATAVFSKRSIKVAPGESAAVSVTFTIPRAAHHRAVVALFRGQVRNNVTASIGTLFTFTLGDEIAIDTAVLDVHPQTSSSNLKVAQQCTNRGTEPVVARGIAAVLDGAGKLVGKTSLETRRLLPGESTKMQGEFAGDLAPGRYRVLVTYDFEGRKTATSTTETVVR